VYVHACVALCTHLLCNVLRLAHTHRVPPPPLILRSLQQPYYKDGPEGGEEGMPGPDGQNYLFPNPGGYPPQKEVRPCRVPVSLQRVCVCACVDGTTVVSAACASESIRACCCCLLLPAAACCCYGSSSLLLAFCAGMACGDADRASLSVVPVGIFNRACWGCRACTRSRCQVEA
jgi:hypothetical protein